MDNVNAKFHRLVTDGETEQVLLLVERDREDDYIGTFYLSSDGDISSDGATFLDEMSSSENYPVGCVPCRTMSVTLMNLNGYLNGHNFGWMEAFIGVRYVHQAQSLPAGTYCEMSYQGKEQSWDGVYSCRTTGFYKDNTLLYAGDCTGMYTMNDGVMYFFIRTGEVVQGYSYDLDTGTVNRAQTSDTMASKFSDGKIVEVSDLIIGNHLFVVENGYEDAYYLTALGKFRVDKPKRTLGQTIEITDAFDVVSLLDVDSTPVIKASAAQDGAQMLTELCEYCGFEPEYNSLVEENRLLETEVVIPQLLDNSYTCRKMISYICEAVGCNVRSIPHTNKLLIYAPDSQRDSMAYPITATRVEANGLEIQEYTTKPIDTVCVKNLAGATVYYPERIGEQVYTYSGNPLVYNATSQIFSYVQQIPTYVPMTISVIEADPSFQCGDALTLSLSYGDDEVLATHDDVDITDSNGEKITVEPSLGKWTVPLISQTIRFNGKTSAEYDIKGSADRTGNTTDEYTSLNSRTSGYSDLTARYISVNAYGDDMEDTAIDAVGAIKSTFGVFEKGVLAGDYKGDQTDWMLWATRYRVNIAGELILGGHTSSVGTVEIVTLSSSMSLAAQTAAATEVLPVTLDPGTWVITGTARFASCSSNARQLVTISATSAHYSSAYRSDTMSLSGQVSQVQCTAIVAPTAQTTYYLNASSSVATTLQATATAIRAVRIA